MSLQKFEGKEFKFVCEFTADVCDGMVYIEEYGEGEFPLSHIKTEK